MIYLTWGQIRNDQFQLALGKLIRAPLPVPVSRQINSIVQGVNIEYQMIEDRLHELRRQFAVIQNGNLVVPDHNEQAYLDGLRSIDAERAEIQVPRIPLSDLGDMVLTAQDLHYLEPLLER